MSLTSDCVRTPLSDIVRVTNLKHQRTNTWCRNVCSRVITSISISHTNHPNLSFDRSFSVIFLWTGKKVKRSISHIYISARRRSELCRKSVRQQQQLTRFTALATRHFQRPNARLGIVLILHESNKQNRRRRSGAARPVLRHTSPRYNSVPFIDGSMLYHCVLGNANAVTVM